MNVKKRPASVATVIGDVVASRSARDRPGLHGRLEELLAEANERFRPEGALRVTVGDEYQGSFGRVGVALQAALWLQARLAPEVDIRHGLGWGPVQVLGEQPRIEDGPGWWSAREAIDAIKAEAKGAGSRLVRTAYRTGQADGPDPAALNAALLCRDQLVGSLSDRSARLLSGLLDGRTQAELAEQEGVSPSAVSQRVRSDGLAVVVAATRLLEDVR
jgi:hypothetical protein